ncbi:O-antigen ligase family protein [Parapedobacter sp. ISTM3]|uniref:O-antigen ligase family protein n=1 Tax=Parapedobacter sp. ISTM3 TaxID=2800130 RepID=UPI0019073501|nr:O-antigen ligase family protein [Parapedobacter sp. ISTM3]MBK1439210.1 O-antigen ligase family protein [Parapedobacter sp. ISTM3]
MADQQLVTLKSRLTIGNLLLFAGIATALATGYVVFRWDILGGVLAALLWGAVAFLIVLFRRPEMGMLVAVAYSFVLPFFGREIVSVPFGIGVEGLLVISWIAALFNASEADWRHVRNDLVGLTLLWFLISVLQVANPSGASVMGWVQELRGAALHALLIIPLVFLVFNKERHLNIFLVLIIALSVLAALNGLRQLRIGLLPGEQAFLEQVASTHLIWGKLRVFSFYTDAGMFGASQAHIALVALILCFGPYKVWVRVLLLIAGGILLYGMLISGTRGALFVLVFGAFSAIFLFKNFKVLTLGLIMGICALAFLKYTHIGSGNYHIYRLRTALDPQDASLNLRFQNQQILNDHLKNKPFGEGLGVIGTWGHEYNSDKFISTIEPDSYWVKVWAMYGVVGLTIWFCMMLYIQGKCGGYIWRIRDPGLRIKLIALLAGTVGIFVSSYGNEVINRIPASLVVYVSWALIYLGPKMDSERR